MIAYFGYEPAAEAVQEIIDQADRDRHRLFLTVANWAEVYYTTMREVSPEAEEAHAQAIANLPIDVIGIGDDLKLARQAAIYKARYQISLSDAFAAALAKEKKAELVTGDPELKQLEKEIMITWLK